MEHSARVCTGVKLNALLTDKAAQQRPPSALVLGFSAKQQTKSYPHQPRLTSLLSLVASKDAMVMGVLSDLVGWCICA